MLFSLMTAEVLRVGDRLTASLPLHHATTMQKVWTRVQPLAQHVYHAMSVSNIAVWILTILLAYAIYEQMTHMRLRTKGQLPGPGMVLPLFGGECRPLHGVYRVCRPCVKRAATYVETVIASARSLSASLHRTHSSAQLFTFKSHTALTSAIQPWCTTSQASSP